MLIGSANVIAEMTTQSHLLLFEQVLVFLVDVTRLR